MMDGVIENGWEAAASPSLRSGTRRAYEVKFNLPDDAARRLESALHARMAVDPHADSPTGSYRVTTLYFDTPDFAMYRKAPGYRTSKHRIRRYGDALEAYLEWKSKRGRRVRKRRTAASIGELSRLAFAADESDRDGAWFAHRLAAKGLVPACRVEYERVALCGHASGGPIRATFDRRLCGSASLAIDQDGPLSPLPIDGTIVEFKFADAMPALFREAIACFGLAETAASKYRACIDVLGLGPARIRLHA
jgi:hypothetical protein